MHRYAFVLNVDVSMLSTDFELDNQDFTIIILKGLNKIVINTARIFATKYICHDSIRFFTIQNGLL